MMVIFIPKPGIDLYRTFLQSETSRLILRFYAPHRRAGGGVEVPVATLGSGLSLTSELRWYIRRYTTDLLFQTRDGLLISHKLAREIYDRILPYPGEDWCHRYTCTVVSDDAINTLSVLCLEEEVDKKEIVSGEHRSDA
ncbi:MAG: DUF5804 family protein [Methanocalculus sp.]|uniref:DUF5804 family protein n=1 Tax=Methanocalculus sp. TaxID=2004547 RepID=UPI00271F7629|nr:DUF5804 family protein [Methanocalculus sp.]MDO9540008.1 DUF5804 family protein [Methanocalculus sp.]